MQVTTLAWLVWVGCRPLRHSLQPRRLHLTQIRYKSACERRELYPASRHAAWTWDKGQGQDIGVRRAWLGCGFFQLILASLGDCTPGLMQQRQYTPKEQTRCTSLHRFGICPLCQSWLER